MSTTSSRAWLVLSVTVGLALPVGGCGRDTLISADVPPPGSGGASGSLPGPGNGGASVPSPDAGGILMGSGGVNGDPVGGAAVTPVGSGGVPGSVWGFGRCPTITTTPGQTNRCGRTNGVAFSPDGTLVTTATDTSTPFVHVWRVSDGHLLYEPDSGNYRDGAYGVAFSPDGKLLASAATAPRTVVNGISSQVDTNTVDIWDGATGAHVVTLPTQCGFYASTAVFSHDGKHLVTAGYRNAIEIWNVADWSRALTIPYTPYSIPAVRYSPDDSRIIAASDGVNTIWNASDGSKLGELSGLSYDINVADYAPDGGMILSTAGAGQIQLTDPNGVNLQAMDLGAGVLPVPRVGDVAWVGNDRILANDSTGLYQEWTRNPGGAAPLFVFSRSWKITDGGGHMAVAPDQSRLVAATDAGFTFLIP